MEISKTIPLGDVEPETLGAASPRFALIAYHREGAEIVPLRPGTALIVGREPPADLVIPDASLSRRHAQFGVESGGVSLQDLGATNGVRLRGERVSRALLHDGDSVLLGLVRVSVHTLAGAERARGLLGHDRFLAALDDEVRRARYFDRPVAVVMVRAARSDGTEVHSVVGDVLELLRPIDRVGFYSPDTLELVLPETSPEEARRRAEQIVQRSVAGRRLYVGYAATRGAAAEARALLGEARLALGEAGLRVPAWGRPLGGEALPNAKVPPEPPDDGAPVARSPAMKRVLAEARKFAANRLSVLIVGEAGSGKEVVARLLHEGGPRAGRRFIALNCAAIPPTLVESTLFGHEVGAFTGAIKRRVGVFEEAKHGTVFLDEVGELEPAIQAKLLRVLELGVVTPMGSNAELEVDFRVVAATNRDVEKMLESGAFRADLYSRLAGTTLRVPPLRERSEDIVPLAERFLRATRKKNPCRAVRFSAATLDALVAYTWPGNARELRNEVERAAAVAEDEEIVPTDLSETVRARGAIVVRPAQTALVPTTGTFRERLQAAEKALLLAALAESDHNVTATARKLDMPLRTLQYKVRELGIRRGPYQAD